MQFSNEYNIFVSSQGSCHKIAKKLSDAAKWFVIGFTISSSLMSISIQ